MKRLALSALATASLVACGDDGSDTPTDAAPATDAEVDAPDLDAPVVTRSGSISVLEVAVLNPGTSGTFFGQGNQVNIGFTSSDAVPGPTMEEMPGSALGCKAWRYDAAQAGAASVGLDEGSVQVAATGTGAPNFPACVHTAGVGYTCPHTGTASTGGTIAAGPQQGTATLTDTDVTFDAGNTTNRYVRITGATTAANNGVFPIVGLVGANTIVFANPAVVAETIPGTGSHVNLAGVGPTPNAPDPGFMGNDNAVTVALTAGGMNHIADFTSTTGAGTTGDDFSLATAESNKLNAIPRDGSAFTITCDAADCPAGSAAGTVLNIVTTDAPTAGLSPFAMPPPMTNRYQVRCSVLGATAITVPAAYSAIVMGAGATRIQASFIRGTLLGGGPPEVSVVAGHAIVGFTN